MEHNDSLLPSGVDIAALLTSGEQESLYAVWNTYRRRLFDRNANAADSAAISPVEALAANRLLVKFLEEWQWVVVQHARAAGDTWSTIGAPLGLTEQEAAAWYQRRTQERQQHDDDFLPAAPGWFPYG